MEEYESYRLEERRLRFEANRHMSTLSVATLILMFTLDQRFAEGEDIVGWGLLLFGASLFFSVLGMFSTFGNDWITRIVEASPGKWCFVVSALFFATGILTLVLFPAVS